MKFVFASDSFKGSLTSAETGAALTAAARAVFGECETCVAPIADGGEGVADAVLSARGGRRIERVVRDPLGAPTRASFGMLSDTEAIIEMASASGLTLVRPEARNPEVTSTYGTGELVRAALELGATDITIGIGGSATNDGGMGFASALGAKFYDRCGERLAGVGGDLARVERVDLSELDPRLSRARITVMCDVTNPLCGETGATRVFGPQKGADPEMVERLELGMQTYRRALLREFGVDANDLPGSGAAGGLGAALRILFNAELKSGIEVMLDLVRFDDLSRSADLIVTGEGRADGQSANGKVLSGVGRRARRLGVPCVALCGSVGDGYRALYDSGISCIMTTVDSPMPLADALARARELYYDGAVRLFQLVKIGFELGARRRSAQ